MAAFVPLSFSLSLSVPLSLFKELHVRKPDIMGSIPIQSIPLTVDLVNPLITSALCGSSTGISERLYPFAARRSYMAMPLLTSSNSNRSISTNWIHHYHSVECSTRRLRESGSFYSNVCFYFTNIVLAGYWVGPDIDDGWGFIEAFVDRIA